MHTLPTSLPPFSNDVFTCFILTSFPSCLYLPFRMSDILIPFPYSEGKFRALLEANLIWPTLPFNQGCTNFLCNPLKVARTFNNQLWIGNVHHYDIQTNLFSVAYPDNDEEELNLHELYESLVWFPGYPSTTNKHTELRADGGSFPLYLINPYDNNDHFSNFSGSNGQ